MNYTVSSHSFSSKSHELTNGQLTLSYDERNVLKTIMSGPVMVGQHETPEFEQAVSNVYLRVKSGEAISVTPLVFFSPETETFRTNAGEVVWQTTNDLFRARVIATLAKDQSIAFVTADVENLSGEAMTFDVIFGQDIALADAGAVKTNEAYASQYLDHEVFHLEGTGYTVCSRQNLPGSTGNPCSQVGSLSEVVGFSTDGIQFFGKSYKVTNQPEAVFQPTLANVKYQYEMGYIALQSADVVLAAGARHSTVFYVDFQPHMADSNVAEARPVAEIASAYVAPGFDKAVAIAQPEFPLSGESVLVGEELTAEEVTGFFGQERRFAEEKDGKLLSFFHTDSRYVTLQEKELHLERSTGHMVSSGNCHDFRNSVMSSTHGMYGVFNSHVVLGNTSFNKMMGVDRTFLNLFKSSGQRIWVRDNGEYRILTMPSAFETGTNFSRWVYKHNGGFIIVRSFSATESTTIQMEVETKGLEPLEILISNQLTMGNNEGEAVVTVNQNDRNIHVTGNHELIAVHHPELSFTMKLDEALTDVEKVTCEEDGSVRYLLLKGQLNDKIIVTIAGSLTDASQQTVETLDFDKEVAAFQRGQNDLINNFRVSFENDEYNAGKLNDTMQWFTHNALVHYATPHGLEQYSGAAWGTRDVSQGPFEFFMSMQRYDKVVDILESIYSHQYVETGTWPQWFMFDQYNTIQQEESHGDIVVWPLKAVADYILTTGDVAVLDRQVPYTSIEQKFAFTEEKFTLFAHLERQVQHIIDNLVPGTHLSCYGDGDWDDTLQPANQALRENMVSGWTIPLTLQTFKTMTRALKGLEQYAEFVARIADLTEKMEADYRKFLIKDGVITGFLHFPEGDIEQPEYLLHPSDQKTGIKYRLLPASRSIISETFDKEMAEQHMAIIEDKLVHPDGVRLMDRMAEYKAGKQTYFKRAELAANLGREVGLQYCHAHIRFIEALAKMGKVDEVYDNLYKILPVGIQSSVPNADLRQSNAYFSSSDGKFNDRYGAYENFSKLKTGEVKVKGGWKIYSSGPGIYINQLISNVLGVRFEGNSLVLDPVISKKLGKVTLNFRLYGKPCELVINPDQGEFTPKCIELNGADIGMTELPNAYRTGGVLVEKSVLDAQLTDVANKLEIWL
ncbi:cellobiose phosphorylase [Endozoicomonas montiporae]|uniref:Cellobiose phosphorylase n=2 Tax=Endozoicomonas montiporae TaxID=1027273 RepID=A0A081N962_9GAMM|nr:cellobiose phosphorylase [Endozoicomonas montiporae]AMO55071.1 putative cellobiose phosphorylase [Endozoicomonas montiporae CL-33]KEQ14985.1 cellobiose phosphorylase [Endozoicomonas montiporae]